MCVADAAVALLTRQHIRVLAVFGESLDYAHLLQVAAQGRLCRWESGLEQLLQQLFLVANSLARNYHLYDFLTCILFAHVLGRNSQLLF